MNAEDYADAIEYEKLTQSIYQAILKNEGTNIEVKHNEDIMGRSGVAHQVDVFWRFRQAGIDHTVLIECKNFSSTLTLEKVRNFFAVLHDIGNCSGIIVTKTGYQSGVVNFAKYYGIKLKLLRAPIDSDWEGRIKDIHVALHFRSAVSTPDKPIKVTLNLKAKNKEQEIRISNAKSDDNGLQIKFYDKSGIARTEDLISWLPRQLKVLDQKDGGPYKAIVPTPDFWIYINQGQEGEELVEVSGLGVEYYVETIQIREFTTYGEEVVESILRDNSSGEIEYIKRKE